MKQSRGDVQYSISQGHGSKKNVVRETALASQLLLTTQPFVTEDWSYRHLEFQSSSSRLSNDHNTKRLPFRQQQMGARVAALSQQIHTTAAAPSEAFALIPFWRKQKTAVATRRRIRHQLMALISQSRCANAALRCARSPSTTRAHWLSSRHGASATAAAVSSSSVPFIYFYYFFFNSTVPPPRLGWSFLWDFRDILKYFSDTPRHNWNFHIFAYQLLIQV